MPKRVRTLKDSSVITKSSKLYSLCLEKGYQCGEKAAEMSYLGFPMTNFQFYNNGNALEAFSFALKIFNENLGFKFSNVNIKLFYITSLPSDPLFDKITSFSEPFEYHAVFIQ